MRYEAKVVVVTGGSRGIGEGCARVFTQAGSRVVICGPGENDGTALAAELTDRGPGEAHYLKCDVNSTADIQNLIDSTVARYGGIDCLINNAGWHPPHRP